MKRALLAFGVLIGALSLVPAVASAATAPPKGHIVSAVQDTFAHKIAVRGWAEDPARPSASIDVRLYLDGKYAGHVLANRPSPNVDKKYGFTGKHDYVISLTATKTAGKITAASRGIHSTSKIVNMTTGPVAHVYPAAGARIITVAKRYVGKARYVEGGASPTRGFDCSGYTAYVYAQAKVKTLPHNAEGQRRLKGMRLISAKSARPGDLVFYLSGGSAYHVAIYAGNHMQYAAATPKDGIRYQAVWSSNVQYRTITH